jgi:hypothetical protein
MLLKAIHYGKGDKVMMDEIRRLLNNGMRIDATTCHFEEPDEEMGWIYHSNVRTTAAVLQAFLEVDGHHPKAELIARWLIRSRQRGRWRTTQENLYVFWALATYFKTYEKEEPDFTAVIKMNERGVLEEIFKGRSLRVVKGEVPLIGLKEGEVYPISFEARGKGRFYYGLWLSYAPKGELRPRNEGIEVTKHYETLEGKRIEDGVFELGKIIRVCLTVTTPKDRNFVVVNDPLPAGFEAVDTSLDTESTEMVEKLQEYRKENEYCWWGGFNRSELRDDEVLVFADYLFAGKHHYSYLVRPTTPGIFALPPTHAEEMYAPEVFGRTGSKEIEIR